jgi:pyridoxamine 5'-phosphate oxidase
MRLARIRHEYRRPALREPSAPPEPMALLRRWLNAAVRAGLPEPTAAALATMDARGRPAARFVLVKRADAAGVVFFTNYASAKGRELAARPYAALTLWWPGLERQVRLEGRVAQLPPEQSDAYFALRPRGAQLGAWASPQSRVVRGRAELKRRLAAATRRFAGRDVPRPPHWGGYRVTPARVEFWQGQPDRMHDRLLYSRRRGGWTIVRLAP